MFVESEIVEPERPTAIAVDADALRELPPRRPADPPARSSRIVWELIDVDRYVVTISGAVAGFIDVVGAVYVVLSGDRCARAVEVAQTLVWSTAVAALDNARTR